ncbi:hypothetical protein EPUS_01494 [Endocarpon pusillum Z07020]|uniref:Uncharacterized protein n=1 Tax=Endocarpon pusillum (strain Z07020 / HMAS-L-300199) TaxID=1263415 RepID=U1HZ51_ENDPU|nr:uncharacterized protein EPUS_01494 [Endocarpon pusillum Z07020]ERF76160.1 hypothetical protein EPUS_01494 [Endocarpon pusillum Z07020]
MCITLSGRAAYCNCAKLLPDNTLVHLCDVALANKRTPCEMVSFPPPDQSLTEPACPRCSQAGHIIVFINPSVSGKASIGGRDEYYIPDVYAELEAQLIAALNSPLPPAASPTVADNKALIEALKDATSFVKVEHEDTEEQFDEDGAPTPGSDNDEDSDGCLDRSQTPVKLGTGFGLALGRLLFSS